MSRRGIEGKSAAVLLMVMLALCFYNPVQTVVVDYFEAASALTSKIMFNEGQWLLPLQDTGAKPYYPAILYWSQLAGYKLFGISAFATRFFTAIAAVFSVIALYKTAARVVGKRTGLRAALITASSLLFLFMSGFATGDMLTAFFLLLNVVFCWNAVEKAMKEEKGATGSLWLGCICGGFALLSGGLLVVFIPVITAFFYLLTIGRLSFLFKKSRLFPGLLLFAVISLTPNVIAVVQESTDLLHVIVTLIHQQMGLVTSVVSGYGSKAVFVFLLFLAGMTPWFCYLALAVTYSSLFSQDTPGQRLVRLLVIFSAAVILVAPFALHGGLTLCVAAIPGAALLLAQLFERIDVQYSKRWVVAGWLSVILFAGLTLVVFVLPTLLNILSARFSVLGRVIPLFSGHVDFGYRFYIAAAILTFLTFVLYRGVVKRKVYAVYNGLIIAACGLSFVAVIVLYPVYDRLILQPVNTLALAGEAYSPEGGIFFSMILVPGPL